MSSFWVKLGFQSSEFKRGIDSARMDVAKLKHEVAASEKRWQSFRAGAAVAAVAAGAFFKSVIDRADQIKDLSDKFGLFSESLQKVGLVAEQNGSSLESVAAAMNKLEVARDKALSGDKGMIANFRELGVSLDDLDTLDAAALMEKIGQGSMHAAPMVAVLGKNALELVGTLEQLKGADVKGIIKDEDVQRMAQIKDDANSILRTLQSAGGSLVSPLIKGLREALKLVGALGAAWHEMAKGTVPGGKSPTFGSIVGAFKDDWKAQTLDEFKQRDKAVHKKSRIRDDGSEAGSGKNSAANSALEREKAAREAFEKARQDAIDNEKRAERDKMRARAGMTGQEIAQSKLADRRAQLAEARGDRQFARKYGKEYLQELKDREDPVKNAEAATKPRWSAPRKRSPMSLANSAKPMPSSATSRRQPTETIGQKSLLGRVNA